MAIAMRVDSVTKDYGSVKALTGISFAVEAGECFGLLGPNGAGKSTLIRILSTIDKATTGSAWVGGMPLETSGQDIRRRVGIALQETGVDPLMTGREVLTLQARLFGWHSQAARTRADGLLERFQLTPVASRLVRTYSGGMRRRLDLAVAIVHQPDIIIMDEPTTGLDPTNRRELWNQLREFTRNDGKTVILTTQYLEEADALCDRVLFIKEGSIWAQGTPDDLKRQMGWSVIRFQVDTEVLPQVLEGLVRDQKSYDVQKNTIEIVSTTPEQDLWKIQQQLQHMSHAMKNLEVRPPSLDEVFLRLVNGESRQGGEMP